MDVDRVADPHVAELRAAAAELRDRPADTAGADGDSSEDRLLLKRFGLFGPPSLLFFDAGGSERREARVVDFVAPAAFASSLAAAGL